MAIRCFARRHLVAARHPLSTPSRQACPPICAHTQLRHASSTSPTDQQNSATTTPTRSTDPAPSVSVLIGQRDVQRPPLMDFFTTRIPPKEERQDNADDTASTEALEVLAREHPLLRDLCEEFDNQKGNPNPEAVWQLYSAILNESKLDFAQQEPSIRGDGQSSRSSFALQLPHDIHARVLHIIAPPSALPIPASSSSSRSTTSSLIESERGQSKLPHLKDVDHFLYQVGVIFGEMRKRNPGKYPSTKHYNAVMHRLATVGSMDGLLRLWATMNGTPLLPSLDAHRRSADENDYPGSAHTPQKPTFWEQSRNERTTATPSRSTYESMLFGIAQHLDRRIAREYGDDRYGELVPGYAMLRKERKKVLKGDELDSGEAQPSSLRINPNVRHLLRLSTQRAVALLKEMTAKGVPMRKISMDSALRIMQITGNADGLKMVTRNAFGVDSDNLDVEANMLDLQPVQGSFLEPDVRSLNTLLLAVSEQSTISKMVATYETLFKPLPVSNAKIEAMNADGYEAGTDFRGMFKWVRTKSIEVEQPVEDAVESSKPVAESSSPEWHPQYAILPNRRTMDSMIRSACTNPLPVRVLLQGYMDLTSAQLAERSKEYHDRWSGRYVNIALYLLDETLALHRGEMMRLAHGLGIKADDVDAEKIMGEIEAMEEDGCLGLPPKEDESYVKEYLTRLFVVAGEEDQALSMWESLSKISSTLAGAGESNEEIEAKQATIAKQQADGRAFLQRHSSHDGTSINVRLIDELTSTPPSSSFVPHLRPLRLTLAAHSVRPVLTLAGTRNASLLRMTGVRMRRAMALYVVELRILALAHTHWHTHVQQRIEATRDDTSEATMAERRAMLALVLELKEQYAFTRGYLEAMAVEYQHRALGRLAKFHTWKRVYLRHQRRRRAEGRVLLRETMQNERGKGSVASRSEEKALRSAGAVFSAAPLRAA